MHVIGKIAVFAILFHTAHVFAYRYLYRHHYK